MGCAGGGVLAVGAAAACCGGMSLGLVGLASGVAAAAAGLSAVLVALVTAIVLGTASIARRRRSVAGAGSQRSEERAGEHRHSGFVRRS
jgi:hypothetical protein